MLFKEQGLWFWNIKRIFFCTFCYSKVTKFDSVQAQFNAYFKVREVILSLVCHILIKFLDVIMFKAIDYTCGFDIWRLCNYGVLVFIK
jgi:hypothetical protein